MTSSQKPCCIVCEFRRQRQWLLGVLAALLLAAPCLGQRTRVDDVRDGVADLKRATEEFQAEQKRKAQAKAAVGFTPLVEPVPGGGGQIRVVGAPSTFQGQLSEVPTWAYVLGALVLIGIAKPTRKRE